MRRQPADLAAERHRDRLGEDRARASPRGSRPSAPASSSRPAIISVRWCERARGEGADLGQRLPLRVPAAEPALVLLDHRGQHRRDEPGHADRRREDAAAADRVALVRHRRGAALPAAAGSNASPTSVCISSETSRAILPSVPASRPSAVATSATRSRWACQGSREARASGPRPARRRRSARPRRAPRACPRRRRTGARARAGAARGSARGAARPRSASPRPSGRT